MCKKSLCIFLVCLVLLAIPGCQTGGITRLSTTAGDLPEKFTVRLVVADDFGHRVLLDETIDVQAGADALDCLLQVASVKTAYGGGFVTSIEGITSGYLNSPSTRQDWFIYVNGFLANTGGKGYTVRPGDTVCWYYRDWSFRQSISALIGSCPHLFLNGYQGKTRPTWIIYEQPHEQAASSLASSFNSMGVDNVNWVLLENIDQTDMQQDNIVVLGSPDFSPLAEINNNWDKLGLFCHFAGAGLNVFDSGGNQVRRYSETTGVILAMQNPFNPRGTGACENVCLVVTGTDEAGIQSAVDAIASRLHEMEYYAGAIVSGQQLLPIP
jgi:hypothetical protein